MNRNHLSSLTRLLAAGTAFALASSLATAQVSPQEPRPGGVFGGQRPGEQQQDQQQKGSGLNYITFTQSEWGKECAAEARLACLRDAKFSSVFRAGLTIGKPDGPKQQQVYGFVIKDSRVLQNILPLSGDIGTMAGVDRPGLKAAGGFAGQLIAAKLNLRFNEGQHFWNQEGARRPAVKLANMYFVKRVDQDLKNLTVREVLDISDRVISGEFGPCAGKDCTDKPIYDVNGDGRPDLSVADLTTALRMFNLSFQDAKRSGVLSRNQVVIQPDGTEIVVEDTEVGDPESGIGAGAPASEEEVAVATGGGDPEAGAPSAGEPVVIDGSDGVEGRDPKINTGGRPTGNPVPRTTDGRPRLASFDQGDWGEPADASDLGRLRDDYFAQAFPNGLVIGDQNPRTEDGKFALVFRTAAEVERFLPAQGKIGTLNADAAGPESSSAGLFAGQLAAAKLNIAYNRLMLGADDRVGKAYRQMVFADCVDERILGRTVEEVLDVADRAISGAYGQVRNDEDRSRKIDVDKDGTPDVSLEDLSRALGVINNNFKDGVNRKCLQLRGTDELREGSAESGGEHDGDEPWRRGEGKKIGHEKHGKGEKEKGKGKGKERGDG